MSLGDFWYLDWILHILGCSKKILYGPHGHSSCKIVSKMRLQFGAIFSKKEEKIKPISLFLLHERQWHFNKIIHTWLYPWNVDYFFTWQFNFHHNIMGTVWATEMVQYSIELSQCQEYFLFSGSFCISCSLAANREIRSVVLICVDFPTLG